MSNLRRYAPLLAIVVVGIGVFFFLQHRAAEKAALRDASRRAHAISTAEMIERARRYSAASDPDGEQGRARAAWAGKRNNTPAPATASDPSNPEPIAENGIVDPAAREALFYVGVDPRANEYWVEAINDPDIPEAERQDLIEDLNEDGISDPHHPTAEDVPIITNRLRLLEAIASDPLDQTNADAFREAYKDLQEMARLASGEAPIEE